MLRQPLLRTGLHQRLLHAKNAQDFYLNDQYWILWIWGLADSWIFAQSRDCLQRLEAWKYNDLNRTQRTHQTCGLRLLKINSIRSNQDQVWNSSLHSSRNYKGVVSRLRGWCLELWSSSVRNVYRQATLSCWQYSSDIQKCHFMCCHLPCFYESDS